MPVYQLTERAQKMQELAKKVPAPLSWVMPDPYDPTSMITPVGGITKAESQIIKKLPLSFRKTLSKVLDHIKEVYPEVENIKLVGGFARGTPDTTMFGGKLKKSDIDLLLEFPKSVDKYSLGRRSDPLWQRWSGYGKESGQPINPWGRTVDFLNTIIGEHSHTGQHLQRLEEGLPTPEISLWKKSVQQESLTGVSAFKQRLKEDLNILDQAGVPDIQYRSLLSTATKKPLKKGETWRGRILKYLEQEE